MTKSATGRRLFVIIVNWNGKQDTLACLSSLEKIERKNIEVHVVVVDNGSTDGSVGEISKKYPKVTVIPAGSNLGFTGGNNIGIAHALDRGADFVWLLNNDTIVDRHALSFLSP